MSIRRNPNVSALQATIKQDAEREMRKITVETLGQASDVHGRRRRGQSITGHSIELAKKMREIQKLEALHGLSPASADSVNRVVAVYEGTVTPEEAIKYADNKAQVRELLRAVLPERNTDKPMTIREASNNLHDWLEALPGPDFEAVVNERLAETDALPRDAANEQLVDGYYSLADDGFGGES